MRAMRLATTLAVLACGLAAIPDPAPASISRSALHHGLARQMQRVGGASGAFVSDLAASRRRTLFSWASRSRRMLASNTKLFTMAPVLDRFGARRSFQTQAYPRPANAVDGHRLRGNLVVVGAGDPALGRAGFARRHGLPLTPLGELAADVRRAGIKRVSGKLLVDDSIFDRRRGIPSSGVDASGELGPLSGLSYDSGIVHGRYAKNPELVAARALKRKLRSAGVRVRKGTGRANLPARALRRTPLGSVSSPPVSALMAATLKPSSNFFSEMLLKRLAASRAGARGTTRRGVRKARRFAHRVGSAVAMENGSGLSRANRASPRQVGHLLAAMDRRPGGKVFRRSLPLAGKEGTLSGRMDGTAAKGRCRAKTGTLIGVSALSGYCEAGHGRVAFSILMSSVDVNAARRAQDRMAALIARYRR